MHAADTTVTETGANSTLRRGRNCIVSKNKQMAMNERRAGKLLDKTSDDGQFF
jgi:hypothetical protein